MRTVGIDLGKSHSQICLGTASGEVLEERQIRTDRLVGYLKRRRRLHVVMESCSEAFALYDGLSVRHRVTVVPSTLSRQLGVGFRGQKTDRNDARALYTSAARIKLPSIHVPSLASRELKARLGMRQRTVKARTALINSVRGYLRTKLWKIKGGATITFTQRVRHLDVPSYVLRQLDIIDSLSTQIEAMNQELEVLAQDKRVQKLMTAPGVGTITALSFLARVDRVERFTSAKHLESYLGLTPGEKSSGNQKRKTSITKAGNSELRWLLIQAAWSAMRCRGKHPILEWAAAIAKKRGKKIATVALARKLAGILYALLRDDSPYKTTVESNG